MGGSFSVSLNQEKDLNHFGVCFGLTDRFRLVLAPSEIVEATRQLLSTRWIIQEVREQPGFVEFKMKRFPFLGDNKSDILVKFMICALLEKYYALGWHFKVLAELSRQIAGDFLIFERSTSLSTFVICLSLNETDKIRVLAPEDLITRIRTIIVSQWSLGIQREKQFEKSWEFKLKGCPWYYWSADGAGSYSSVKMMNCIISMLYQQGWVMVGAIKSARTESNLKSLYFRFDPSVKDQTSRFFALSLHKNSILRMSDAPDELIRAVKATIPQYWSQGIEKETKMKGIYEFKINGWPWWAKGTDTVDSRRLIAGILNTLKVYNWDVYTTCEFTIPKAAKSVFFFRNDTTENIRPLKPVCISLNESDKIRVINGSVDVMNAVQDSIVHGWPKGIQRIQQYGESLQFHLNGKPFESYDENRIHCLVTMMHILNNLQNQGLRFICTADVSSKYEGKDLNDSFSYPIDLSSWFFSAP